MTHSTSTDDDAEQANRSPDDASTADIAAALRGRRLFQRQLAQKIDGCRRCLEKNLKRDYADVDRVDPAFDDGDAVTIHAVHADLDWAGPHWRMTAVEHRRHPQLEFVDAASAGTDLVRAHARIREREHTHIIDVDVVERSPRGEGPDQSVVGKREQEHIVRDAPYHPDDTAVVERDADEAPAHWPDEDRQWLKELADANTLEVPTYSIAEVDPSDANPGGDDR